MVSKTDDIYSVLSKKYKLHRNVIQMICTHPFIFASRRIADPDDEKNIMFMHLFKLKLKKRVKGKKRESYAIAQSKKDNNKPCHEGI